MKYFLLYNMNSITKDKLLNGYLDDGYVVVFQDQNTILIKKSDIEIQDENMYIKTIISFIKKYPGLNKRGHVIDLSDAFEYLIEKKSSKFNKFSWRFSWYIRNAITHELIKWGDYN